MEKYTLLVVDKCITAAIFFWCVVNMILKHIVIAYTNICLKTGIMLRIVLKFNKTLTLLYTDYFRYFYQKY